jgi:hypothetical protein
MASRPYTDGSNGNGLTDAAALLRYLEQHPLGFFDVPFIRSYAPLLRAAVAQHAALALFDTRAMSAEAVRSMAAHMFGQLAPAVLQDNALAAQREAAVRDMAQQRIASGCARCWTGSRCGARRLPRAARRALRRYARRWRAWRRCCGARCARSGARSRTRSCT